MVWGECTTEPTERIVGHEKVVGTSRGRLGIDGERPQPEGSPE